MKRADLILLEHFLEDYGDKLGAAGCNDMPQEVFAKIEEPRMNMLMADYNAWDAKANPDGYEGPVALEDRENIPDFCWVGYLLGQIRAEIN